MYLVILAWACSTVSGAGQSASPDASPGQQIYIQSCAECHGENGDGKGTKKVYPPPRNFRSGGFSFGNTEAAILRTVTSGIPGTAMSPFDHTLTEEERRAVAGYVRTLLPKSALVISKARRLVVTSKAKIVRGYVRSSVKGQETWPRGLVCGLPGGLTLSFRIDDVRLLEVRRGPFVDRTDWGGRGGTPLELLGRPFYSANGGNPKPAFSHVGAFGVQPLRARLRATEVHGKITRLFYHLTGSGLPSVPVEDAHVVPRVRGATGFARKLILGPVSRETRLCFEICTLPSGAVFTGGLPEEPVTRGPQRMGAPEEYPHWVTARLKNGEVLAVRIEAPDETAILESRRSLSLVLTLEPGERVTLDTALLGCPKWTAEIQDNLEGDLEAGW